MTGRAPLRCLVTGASRGIGRTIAEHLAADGHRVALTARTVGDLEALAAALPVPTLVLPADVTDPAAPEQLVAQVESAWGGLDVLVLNAGEAISAPVHRTDDELWQQMMDVNLTAPFRFIRAAVPSMKQAGFGRIVVVASIASKVGAPYITAYAAAKHGILGVVRSVAMEVATTGVTVNAVCPGYVDTPLTARSLETIVAKTGVDLATARATLEDAHPIKRLITTDEVAAVVDLLVADTGGINGQGIVIDGGSVQS
jgi:NAD(P)-dependent dehydrogenase (short-subunit alcohol dehydrogenase family)